MVWFLNAKIYLILVIIGATVYANQDTNYTDAEKKSLEQFHEMVSDLLYLDYQKCDSFLIPWLRIAELDLNRAEEQLSNSLKWRKENGIDFILEDEDLIKLEQIFPHSLDSVDKEGRPVLALHFLSWDIRKFMLAGQGKNLTRYLDYLFEKVATKTRDLANSTQTDITQADLLVDLIGFSVRQHACLKCLSFYVDLVKHYDNHYPYKFKHGILINTSRGFHSLLQILRRIIPQSNLKQSLSIYGLNKAEWSQVLLDIISPEQLPATFGGTRGQNNI